MRFFVRLGGSQEVIVILKSEVVRFCWAIKILEASVQNFISIYSNLNTFKYLYLGYLSNELKDDGMGSRHFLV